MPMRIAVFFLALCLLQSAAAESLRVAVASNFLATAEALGERFSADTGVDVDLISGSTGKLYAQIVNGAPFDVFLAADVARPERLEALGIAVSGSRFTYATGTLLLWARNVRGSGEACIDALLEAESPRVAIANPDIAPYGAAARQYLEQTGLWDGLASRVVTGENISQALAFVSVGGADFGFIAASQASAIDPDACLWRVPDTLYSPIQQQAVVLPRGGSSAEGFVAFLKGDGRALIEASGYRVIADD